jgi:hypothetical protein
MLRSCCLIFFSLIPSSLFFFSLIFSFFFFFFLGGDGVGIGIRRGRRRDLLGCRKARVG